MYGLSQLRTLLRDPRWFYREPHRILTHYRTGHDYYPNGVDIFTEDWDNLIILDAARYDFFEEQNELEGKLEKRLSRGATSSEFIRGNFRERTLHDTVYVSANPHYAFLKDELNTEVHEYIPLHNGEYRDAVDGITTKPATVTEQALKANEEFPEKRLVVHYLQPHQPYLSERATREIEHGRGIIETLNKNDISIAELRDFYRENLDLVLAEVETLANSVKGKTVVTADHGEMLGERWPTLPIRDYGHYDGLYTPELLEVPWFIPKYEERKTVKSESPAREVDINKSDVEQNLRDLGYM